MLNLLFRPAIHSSELHAGEPIFLLAILAALLLFFRREISNLFKRRR